MLVGGLEGSRDGWRQRPCPIPWRHWGVVTAKVNGKEAKFIAEYKGGKQYAYYVEYTFDATKDYLLGDVNSDGKVNLFDAILVQKYSVGIITFTDKQIAIADVSRDGKVKIDRKSVV